MNQTNPDIVIQKKPLAENSWTFQFSIRGLMIAMAIVAAILAAAVAPPILAVGALLAWIATTAVVLTTVVAGRGWIQAFAIGAFVPNLFSYLAMFQGPVSPEGVLVIALLSVFASIVVGGVTACTHGYLKRRNGQLCVPDLPIARDWLFNPDKPGNTGS